MAMSVTLLVNSRAWHTESKATFLRAASISGFYSTDSRTSAASQKRSPAG